ncbi:MAG: hypothetical protein KIS66_16730 [Fimbriimonadaceae bacterium]|nr:hypothetical protein [Fimbriimonadaceae bacterium]
MHRILQTHISDSHAAAADHGRPKWALNDERTLKYGTVHGFERKTFGGPPYVVRIGDKESPPFRYCYDAHFWFFMQAKKITEAGS